MTANRIKIRPDLRAVLVTCEVRRLKEPDRIGEIGHFRFHRMSSDRMHFIRSNHSAKMTSEWYAPFFLIINFFSFSLFHFRYIFLLSLFFFEEFENVEIVFSHQFTFFLFSYIILIRFFINFKILIFLILCTSNIFFF